MLSSISLTKPHLVHLINIIALIHMNYETEIHIDEVCQIFLQKHP